LLLAQTLAAADRLGEAAEPADACRATVLSRGVVAVEPPWQAQTDLARWDIRCGRYAEAESLRAAAARTAPPAAAVALDVSRAECLRKLGRHADAEPLFRSAHQRAVEAGDRPHQTAGWLADLYADWANPTEAARWRAEAARLAPQLAPPPRPVSTPPAEARRPE
jgi:tetratricopeptide (TPR) repeat protein